MEDLERDGASIGKQENEIVPFNVVLLQRVVDLRHYNLLVHRFQNAAVQDAGLLWHSYVADENVDVLSTANFAYVNNEEYFLAMETLLESLDFICSQLVLMRAAGSWLVNS